MRARRFAVLTLSLIALLPSRGRAQTAATRATRAEVIRGRVTTDSGVAVSGADVIVTMAPSAETFSTLTGPGGDYSISIANGTGEYLIYAGALGRKAVRQRLTRSGVDSIYTFNATLAKTVATVSAMKVQVSRVHPARSAGTANGAGTDGTDKTFDGVGGALPPELAGNLDAMGSLIPGIAATPAGLSAFGLGADNNQTTLNGLAFAGTDLPRDAKTSTRFQLSPWDPASGGFAGALVAVTLAQGDNVAQRHGHVTLDNPALQYSDPLSARAGQKISNVQLSEGGSGPLVLDKYFYNYGLQATRSTAAVSSLAALDRDVLTHAGLSPDSAARVLQVLSADQIPVRAGDIPTARTTTTASFMERIDHSPSAAIAGRAPSRTWSVTGYGRYALTEAASLSPTATPAFSGKSTNAVGALQGIYSAYFGADDQYLNETTTGISITDVHGTPYAAMPGGDVLVSSEFSDGSTGLATAAFGGNSLLANGVRSWSWETVNQTTFQPAGRATMPLHLYLQSRYTGFTQSVPANRDGRFDFASISDLAANLPSAYSRTLNEPDRADGEWVGAAALGGSWTTGRVVWTGGLRADASVFPTTPALNPDVLRAFGVRTDHAPADIGVSPRLGFNWYYHGARPGAFGTVSGSSVSLFRGASQIRGGVGEFRNALPATLLSDAIGTTGLNGAAQQLRCVGSAVPVPDWQAYQADPRTIPDQCANGAAAFTDSARAVTVFDKSFTAPRTWKGTLGWTTWNDLFYLAIDGTYALNLNQPGTVDLNFAGQAAFTLADEGNRPVFVSPASIVSGTGSVTPVGSRRVDAFGRVADRVSDLRSDARQITVYALPSMPLRWGTVSLSYTYIDAHGQARGFDQSTVGDPRVVEWAPASVPRHQVIAQAYHYFLKGDLALTTSVRASSGLPFTPLVSGDVNGDGASNDRAFVFDPATAKDATVAAGMRALLDNGSGSARACLQRQLGELAGRNSCVAPWSATMNAGIFFGHTVPGARRARVSLNVLNVLGGADQLLHGSANLHGWGAAPLPDPILTRVRGFDPVAQRFLYDVNGRFGSASPGTTTLRAPFRLSLDVSLDLGRSAAVQRLEQNLRVRPGLVGTRAPVDTIRKRYGAGFQDIYGALLRLSDSLALSADQMRRVQERRPMLQNRADSIYSGLTAFLATLAEKYDQDAAVARVNDATEAMWQAIYDEVPFLKSLLTSGQIRRLPSGMSQMITVPNFRIRFFFGP